MLTNMILLDGLHDWRDIGSAIFGSANVLLLKRDASTAFVHQQRAWQ